MGIANASADARNGDIPNDSNQRGYIYTIWYGNDKYTKNYISNYFFILKIQKKKKIFIH